MSCSSKGCPIRVTDLGWGPKSSHFLVRGVSFALDAGDRLAIVGPNGAGKTTLLRCLYRGVSPLEGRVEVDGQDIWSVSARQVARRVAVVLQEMPGDFPFTVRDVVMMGRVPWAFPAGMIRTEPKPNTPSTISIFFVWRTASSRPSRVAKSSACLWRVPSPRSRRS